MCYENRLYLFNYTAQLNIGFYVRYKQRTCTWAYSLQKKQQKQYFKLWVKNQE
jgi:hypothetical protein